MMIFLNWLMGQLPSRNFLKRLMPGLPAALVCLAWIPFGLILLGWSTMHVRGYYIGTANNALAAGDFDAARVAYERLLTLSTNESESYVFGLAKSLRGLGQEQEAMTLIKRLAPLDTPGFVPAHFYLATNYIGNVERGESSDPVAAMNMAMAHLGTVIALDPDNVEAHIWMGQLCMRMQKIREAKDHFIKAITSKNELTPTLERTIKKLPLTLARICLTLDDPTSARNWAERAMNYYRGMADSNPSIENILGLAEANMLLDKYDDAMKAFDQIVTGMEKEIKPGTDKQAQAARAFAIAQMCASWSSLIARMKPADVGMRLKCVQKGLLHWPQQEQLLRELVAITRVTGPDGAAARESLNHILANGGTSPLLHVIMGLDAWDRGDIEAAREHCSIAYDLAPQTSTIANNMAMILTLGNDPDLPRALKIADAILAQKPENPNYHETRGQVLVKMGRYHDAMLDLEYAVQYMPDSASTHAAMAVACEKLGLKELAAEHKKIAAANSGKNQPKTTAAATATASDKPASTSRTNSPSITKTNAVQTPAK